MEESDSDYGRDGRKGKWLPIKSIGKTAMTASRRVLCCALDPSSRQYSLLKESAPTDSAGGPSASKRRQRLASWQLSESLRVYELRPRTGGRRPQWSGSRHFPY